MAGRRVVPSGGAAAWILGARPAGTRTGHASRSKGAFAPRSTGVPSMILPATSYVYTQVISKGYFNPIQFSLTTPASGLYGCPGSCDEGQKQNFGSYAQGTTLAFTVTDQNSGMNTVVTSAQQYGPGEWVWSYNAWQIEVTAVSVTAANTLGSHPGLMNRPQCQTTNPVNCATGNFTHTFTDLAVPGRGLALNLTRTYNSLAASTQGMFGYGWTSSYETSLSFDGNGNATVHQDEGAQATFFANGSGFTAPPQVLGTLGRNSDGTYTLTQRGKTQYKFSSSGQLLSESDLNGYTTAMAYNGAGRLSTVTDPAGRTLTFSYGSNGSVASVVDNAGRTVSYGYDGSGNLTGVTDAKGGLTSFGYDANHLLTSMTDPRNDGSLTNTYDSQGRVIKQLDPLGRKTLFAYGSPSSSGSWTTTMTSPNGNVTSENYTDGILTSLTKGYGTSSAATWTYGYDQTLGVSSTTDPDGHVWTAGYDLNGNQLWSRDPRQHDRQYV